MYYKLGTTSEVKIRKGNNVHCYDETKTIGKVIQILMQEDLTGI